MARKRGGKCLLFLSFLIDGGTREQERLHLPVMRELNSRLIGLDQCEDVIFRAIEDTFENSEIAHHTCELSKKNKEKKSVNEKQRDVDRVSEIPTSRIKILAPMKHNLVSVVCNFQIIVTRIHRTSDEEIVPNDDLLDTLLLLIGADDVGGGGPEKVIAE